MVRKIISTFFFILGGFFVYAVCLLAFINIPEVGVFKFAIIGGFSIPALIFLVIGAAICRFQNWKSSIGTAILSGVGFNLLVVITFICFLLTPEFKKSFPDNKIASFNDYFSGFSVMLILAGLGGFMLKTNKRNIAEPAHEPDGV
jgi:hypothetical protein